MQHRRSIAGAFCEAHNGVIPIWVFTAQRQNSLPRANASTDVRSVENQRPFLLQQNLYFRPLLQGHGAYGSVPG